MKFWLQVITILVTLILVSIWAKPVIANDTNSQTNTSGSNTNITGGYTATTTNNNDGQTNTTTNTTTSTTNGSDVPPPSANSPSYSSMSQDVCKIGPQAAEMWEKYPELRPDYEEHLAKQKVVARIDEEIAEKERIEAERIAAEEAEAARIEAERIEQELLTLKEENEVNDIEPVIDIVPVNMHGE
jgi:hypothetical protein